MPKINLVIDQGATFNTQIDLTNDAGDPLNVTGYTANGQIRKHYDSNTAVILTTNLANGSLSLSLSANQTANMSYGRYVYDVKIINDSNTVTRLIEGLVTVTPGVTR